jgi:hypothetical protein
VRAATIAVCFLSLSRQETAAIRFDDFASTQTLQLMGDASIKDKALRLTGARNNRSGAAWAVEKQTVGSGFDTTFQFKLTKQGGLGNGADGFAFVVQNSGTRALGGRGSAGGFAVEDPTYSRNKGIPWSIAVFFDTFQNEDENDPSDNYVTFRTHGRPAEMRWPPERLALTLNLPVELKDGRTHTARIRFRPPMLSVYVDGMSKPVLEAAVDFSIVTDRQGAAWVGFTASTGGGYENHDILNWSFTSENVATSMSVISSEITFLMSECLPDRSLCTPERALVEPREGGFHVVLPAHLEWGASIPNPEGRPVIIENAHGIVCRAKNCSGPEGSGEAPGDGFLMPGLPAGALIMTDREGRAWFSVNGRGGTGFKASEGFYEFDASLRK